MERARLAVLVGGASARMGGKPKGLLDAGSGETIVSRLVRIGHELGLDVVLSGSIAAYDALGVRRVPDTAEAAGPLAGLVAILDDAHGDDAIVVACDMPRVEKSVIERLAKLPTGTTAAPKIGDVWQPTIARYAASTRREANARLARGERSLFRLLDAVEAQTLPLDEREEKSLVDWDTPDDVRTT